MNLYEIEMQYREIADELFDSGGSLTPELEARLAISEEMFEKKAASYGLIIKEMNGDIEQLENAITDLTKRKKRIEASRDNLKSRILQAMLLFGKEKFKTNLLSMWVGYSKKLVILHEHLIPDAYRREVIEYKIEAAALKKALIDGQIESDSAYVAEEPNLQIR
jgi:septal ring factor EnvC (AmiA/AmiB activator)